MESTKVFTDLKIDLKSLLLDQKVEHLEKLLDNAIEAKVARMNAREIKGFLVGMLLTSDNFSVADIVDALEFPGTEISLSTLLEEPEEEDQMKKPVITEFPGDKFKSATEVPLPAEKRVKAPRIDVAVMKKGMLGSNTITAFELKMSSQRGEILKAFSQAKAYLEFCDASCVVLSPMAFIKQYDVIQSQIKNHEDLGVWIVSKRRRISVIREIPLIGTTNNAKVEVIHFINGENGEKSKDILTKIGKGFLGK